MGGGVGPWRMTYSDWHPRGLRDTIGRRRRRSRCTGREYSHWPLDLITVSYVPFMDPRLLLDLTHLFFFTPLRPTCPGFVLIPRCRRHYVVTCAVMLELLGSDRKSMGLTDERCNV